MSGCLDCRLVILSKCMIKTRELFAERSKFGLHILQKL